MKRKDSITILRRDQSFRVNENSIRFTPKYFTPQKYDDSNVTREYSDDLHKTEKLLEHFKQKYGFVVSTPTRNSFLSDTTLSFDTATNKIKLNLSKRPDDSLYDSFSVENITLETLIEWGDFYKKNKIDMYGRISLKQLSDLQSPLIELNNMVGLRKFKETLVEQILMCLQGLHKTPTEDEMFHTVIYGPPGVGKTKLARILGHIYIAMGLIHKRKIDLDNFKIDDYFETASRADLIGMYCGHTAVQTQKIIDKCRLMGKVLFIDETYSLGDKEGRDNFSKECLDTINKNLTEGAGEFICIIAGYPEDIKKCFFAHNKGLERRFNFKYTVDKYEPSELLEMFLLKLRDNGWGVENDEVIDAKFFEENVDYFSNFGGDIVAFLTKCKINYAKRVFSMRDEINRCLNSDDIKAALVQFKLEREESVKKMREARVKEEKEKRDKEEKERMEKIRDENMRFMYF